MAGCEPTDSRVDTTAAPAGTMTGLATTLHAHRHRRASSSRPYVHAVPLTGYGVID